MDVSQRDIGQIDSSNPAAVVLVSMPYASVERPSLALGSLGAGLRAAGIAAVEIHATLRFADRIGLWGYESINAAPFTWRVGEWTFAEAAFPDADLDAEGYLAELAVLTGLADIAARLAPVRAAAGRFVRDLAAEIVARRPGIVGCSSVFQQHAASLALLRAIKALDPSIVTVLGGGNCEGPMGWATLVANDCVDYVVSGEADALLPPLCRRLLDARPAVPDDDLPPGVFGPADRRRTAPPPPDRLYARMPSLDGVAAPDYQSYFAALEATAFRRHVVPGLPIETARGCWWGQKHHCAFCGIPGSGLRFRSKPPEAVRGELAGLAARHGITRFSPADNVVDLGYFDTVFPALRGAGAPYHLFFQIKANLKRPQVALLAQAGARWLQPGIEALSDSMLKLLSKGASAMINLQLLKWARQYGLWLLWHMLHGAPGERDIWHADVAGWLPLIAHFQPPSLPAMTRVEFIRFSPFVEDAARFGLDLVPAWSYAHTLACPPELRAHLAYAFTDRRAQAADGPGATALNAALRDWYDGFTHYPDGSVPTMRPEAPTLHAVPDGDGWTVIDTRPCRVRAVHRLEPLAVAVLTACDAAQRLPVLTAALADTADLRRTLDALIEAGLLLRLGDQLLSLVLDHAPHAYPAPRDFPAGQLSIRPLPDNALSRPLEPEETADDPRGEIPAERAHRDDFRRPGQACPGVVEFVADVP